MTAQTVKLFEVRDRATTMACIGIAIEANICRVDDPVQSREFLLKRRAGYGYRCILFGSLEGGPFAHDPHDQPAGARTRQAAHAYIEEHWDTLQSGDLVDVEFILGETTAPKSTDL